MRKEAAALAATSEAETSPERIKEEKGQKVMPVEASSGHFVCLFLWNFFGNAVPLFSHKAQRVWPGVLLSRYSSMSW